MPLHPVLRSLIDAARAAGRPDYADCTAEEARALGAARRSAYGRGPEVAAVEELRIPTRNGQVAGRLFLPAAGGAGLVVYVHGGGWVTGTLEDYDIVARTLAHRSGCAVLLVDYRLAPEHPFPAPLFDVQDALRWVARDPAAGRPLLVAGDSAGANLATVAAFTLRQEVALSLQLLLYPVTDCDTETPCYRSFGAGYLLSQRSMQWFLRHYAGRHPPHDPLISPLRTPDLRGAPPAWIATAEYDVLRDEAEAYAARLQTAGVRVDLRRYDGLAHGFARMVNLVDAADQAMTEAAAALQAAAATSVAKR